MISSTMKPFSPAPLNAFQEKILAEAIKLKHNFGVTDRLRIEMIQSEIEHYKSQGRTYLVDYPTNKIINNLCSKLGEARKGKIMDHSPDIKRNRYDPDRYSELNFPDRQTAYREKSTSRKDLAANQGEDD